MRIRMAIEALVPTPATLSWGAARLIETPD
jgi:hypothetical protein